jgi:hypothetical protein
VSQYIIGKNIAIYCNNISSYIILENQKYIIIISKAIVI